MIRPSLRQLSYLIAIFEHGSFIRAAEECAVTQSTLSAGIKELETILGQQLVIRNRKAATLTPFGLEVLDQARNIVKNTDQIVARSKLLGEPLSGPHRVSLRHTKPHTAYLIRRTILRRLQRPNKRQRQNKHQRP